MPIKANAAFAGPWHFGDRRGEVRYLTTAEIEQIFGGNAPPGHPDRRKIGWYWGQYANGGMDWRGPFGSSRKAFKDAQEHSKKGKDQ